MTAVVAVLLVRYPVGGNPHLTCVFVIFYRILFIESLFYLFMHNILLMKKTEQLEKLSSSLGFTSTEFVAPITAKTPKELLNALKIKGLKIYIAHDEKMLRFALEKTNVDIVYGMENINPRDHTHYARGGLDQITCKIAASRGKTLAFSFSEILHSKNKGKLLGRIILNLKLCRKYKVKTIFGNFSTKKEEMRSKKDLAAFRRILT